MLRKRIISQILAIQAVAAALFVGIYLVIYDSYAELEQRNLETNLARIENALAREVDNLDRYTGQWGERGFLYYSMRNDDRVTLWLRRMAVNSIIGSFDIDKALVYNREGELIVAKERDLNGDYLDLDAQHPVRRLLAENPVLLEHRDLNQSNKGLLPLGGELYLLSSRAISSGFDEEVRGTLVSLVKFNQVSIERLGTLVSADLTLLNVAETPSHLPIAELQASREKVLLQPGPENTMVSYALLEDINGEASIVLSVNSERAIMAKAKQTVLTTGAILFFSFAALAIYFIALLDRSVLRRVKILSNSAKSIAESDSDKRLKVVGRDEITSLTEAFNGLLDSLKNTQSELREERDKARTTLAAIGDGVIATDAAGHIQYLNKTAVDLLVCDGLDALNKPLAEVFSPVNEVGQLPSNTLVEKCLSSKGRVGDDEYCYLSARRDEPMIIESLACPVKDSVGKVTGTVIIFRDVTNTQTLQKNLVYQASHDSLTKLNNRAEFERQLSVVVKNANQTGRHHHLLFIDLDHFKLINDSCGHFSGDKVLQEIAAIMKKQIRTSDVLARIGGDEFGVIVSDCKFSKAYEIAEKLREKITEFRFLYDDKCFNVGASIGLVDVQANLKIGDASLLSLADKACMAAKNSGRNRIHVYELSDESLKLYEQHTQWVSRVTDALEHDHFELYYQKIVPADGSNPSMAEILLRMSDGEGGVIGPGAFLSSAERYGLMRFVDKWVIEHFCCWAKQHPEVFDKVSQFSINLSGQSLSDTEFLKFLLAYFEEPIICPKYICFEITETAAIQNIAKASHFISTLKSRGFSFSLDDFGSGMSSFSYLKNLPVDSLKIDGVFVKNIDQEAVDYNLVRTINDMGHLMGMKTVAEFVENETILKLVDELGVDYSQGYHLHKPEPLSGLLEAAQAPQAAIQK